MKRGKRLDSLIFLRKKYFSCFKLIKKMVLSFFESSVVKKPYQLTKLASGMHPIYRNKLAKNAKISIFLFFISNQKCKWWCFSHWIIGLWKKNHPSKVKMHFYSDESGQCPYAHVFWNVCGFKIQESVQAQIYKPQFQSGPNSPTHHYIFTWKSWNLFPDAFDPRPFYLKKKTYRYT